MQQIAPEVAAVQEKYKEDPKRVQIEIMNLYRERKMNPASGCLPLLIQMPFLIGMFDLLKSSFALRGAPFIPGWIDTSPTRCGLQLEQADLFHRYRVPHSPHFAGDCDVRAAAADVDSPCRRFPDDRSATPTARHGEHDDRGFCCDVLQLPIWIEHLLALIDAFGHCTAVVDDEADAKTACRNRGRTQESAREKGKRGQSVGKERHASMGTFSKPA